MLSKNSYEFDTTPPSLRGSRSRAGIRSLLARKQCFSDLSMGGSRIGRGFFNLGLSSGGRDYVPSCSRLGRVVCADCYGLAFPAVHRSGFLLAGGQEGEFVVPFRSVRRRRGRQVPHPNVSVRVPVGNVGNVFHEGDVLTCFSSPRCEEGDSKVAGCKAMKLRSVLGGRSLVRCQKIGRFGPGCRAGLSQFFFVPRRIRVLPRSSSVVMQGGDVVKVSAQVALGAEDEINNLIQVREGGGEVRLGVFSKSVRFPKRVSGVFQRGNVLVPPKAGSGRSGGQGG